MTVNPPVLEPTRGNQCALVVFAHSPCKMEIEARARGARAIYLLTGDAVPFFARLGYAPCGRDAMPPAIAASPHFAKSRLASATAMAKQV